MTAANSKKTPGFGNAEKDKLRDESSTKENNRSIEVHQQAAQHFSRASKHHIDASRHHYDGNHEKANESTLMAIGEAMLGLEYQSEEAKRQAKEH